MAYFKKPGYTQVPNEIFDTLMPSLSGAQLKVLLWVTRQTLGWHRETWKMTMIDIAAATGLSKTGALESIQVLEERGLIEQKRNFVNDNQIRATASDYSLSIEGDDESTVNSGDRQKIDGQLRRPSEKSTVNSGDRVTVNSGDQHIRSKEISSKTEELKDKTTSLPSEDQTQTPTTEALLLVEETPLVPPPAPCDEEYSSLQSNLDLEDDVLVFVRNIYKRERRITIKPKSLAPSEALIRRRESEYGPEDFRRGLICYLNQNHESVTDKKWPISWYLSDPSKNIPDLPPSERPMQSPRHSPTTASPEVPATAPASFSDPLKNPLTYLELWNTIVYESPVDVDAVPGFTMAALKKAILDGDFRKCFEEVCNKCQRMNANGQPVKFAGLFMGFVPLWQKIYAGTEDWKMGKESEYDKALAAAEREERGGN